MARRAPVFGPRYVVLRVDAKGVVRPRPPHTRLVPRGRYPRIRGQVGGARRCRVSEFGVAVMSLFSASASINWLTVFLVGLTMFMVGGGAQALLEIDRKKADQHDTAVLEFFLSVAKRLGLCLIGVGLGLWAWIAWQ
jgi:hypothetical protein